MSNSSYLLYSLLFKLSNRDVRGLGLVESRVKLSTNVIRLSFEQSLNLKKIRYRLLSSQ